MGPDIYTVFLVAYYYDRNMNSVRRTIQAMNYFPAKAHLILYYDNGFKNV
jgi:hypothetical protein